MKKALITGISGFAGSHLAEELLKRKISVSGIVHPNHPTKNIDQIKNKLKLHRFDILNPELFRKLLEENTFDFIFHLAAFSSTLQSFKTPKETLENNIFCELNLLEGLKKAKSKSKVLIIGSADVYGNTKENLPITENTSFFPTSPYAVSKVAQDMLALAYYNRDQLSIVRVRPFNHIGPRQARGFVVPDFVSQIVSIEKKGGGEIKVGNLNTWRDFTDVRDMIKAYILALEKGKVGDVYNIGTGKLIKIEEILNKLLKLTPAKIKVIKEDSLFRESEQVKVTSDFSKFKNQTGWQSQITIEKTLSDTIEYERNNTN